MMTRFPFLALLLALHCTPTEASPFVRVPLPRGFHPNSIAAADFNGDGHADVALCGQNERLFVFAGDRHGGLRSIPQDAQCGAHPTAMTAADLDGDGRIDVVVANHDTDYLTFLRNEGGGRFTSHRVHVHSYPHPHTVTAADVNSDGHVDLITDSWGEDRLTLLLADGHGGWQSPGTSIEIGRKPYINVIAADLDGDGHVDLVMPNSGFDSVSILFGDGQGHFQHAPQSPIVAGPTPFMVAVADVNGDGRPDMLVANYSGHITDISRDGVTWIRNDGARHFTAFPERIAIGHGCWRIASGDLNGDGFADAAFINAADATVSVIYGSPTGPRTGPTLAVMPSPHNLAIADRRLVVITDERDELLVGPLR